MDLSYCIKHYPWLKKKSIKIWDLFDVKEIFNVHLLMKEFLIHRTLYQKNFDFSGYLILPYFVWRELIGRRIYGMYFQYIIKTQSENEHETKKKSQNWGCWKKMVSKLKYHIRKKKNSGSF